MLQKMTLTVTERLLLLSLLPAEGNFTNLKLIRLSKEDLSFSDDEQSFLKFRDVQLPDGTNSIKWEDGLADKEVEIGNHVSGIIRDKLVEMNAAEQLKVDHISLYEKFVEEESTAH